MKFDPVPVVNWHNAKPNALQITVGDVQATVLAVPYWRASTKARCPFRVTYGVYSQQAAMLAQSRYQTALVEYSIKLQDWQRRKDENERDLRRGGTSTAGLSGIALALSQPRPPARPTDADSAEYHWSNTLVATINVDATQPACKPKSVLPGASEHLFDWIAVHSSPTALPGPSASAADVDATLVGKYHAGFIAPLQEAAIQARIASERYQFVGKYEAHSIDYDKAPEVFHCHVWRVQVDHGGKKTTLLMGADGEIFGKPLTFVSKAAKAAAATLVALAGVVAVWVGVAKSGAPPLPASSSVVAQAAALPAPALPRPVVAPTRADAHPAPTVPSDAGRAVTTSVATGADDKPAPAAETNVAASASTVAMAVEPRVSADDGRLIGDMLASAGKRDWIGVDQKAQAIKSSFMPPPRGDRKAARAANTKGLELLGQAQFDEAIGVFSSAFAADPSDLEILNNLGYSNISAGKFAAGVDYVGQAIARAPDRTSAWANLSEALAGLGKEDEALAAMNLAVLFSANREKSIDYLNGIRDNHKSPAFRTVAARTLDQIDAIPARGLANAPATAPTTAATGEAGQAPAVAAAGRFVLQVGAVEDAALAREMRQKVQALGLQTYTQVAATTAGPRIRIRVGPFVSRDDADKAATAARAAGITAVVLTL